jgi:hypothetical protein
MLRSLQWIHALDVAADRGFRHGRNGADQEGLRNRLGLEPRQPCRKINLVDLSGPRKDKRIWK